MGNYRYDDRVRDRRFPLVDEEARARLFLPRCLTMPAGSENSRLTDGRVVDSPFKDAQAACVRSSFSRSATAKIQQVENGLHRVPYNIPSPWIQY